jgi:hypothetical protein
LKSLIDELFSNGGGDHSANLWPAIAYQVAPHILADVLAGRSTAADVAALVDHAQSAVSAGDKWQIAEKEAIGALAIDPATWFDAPVDDTTAEEVASRAEQALGAPEALASWLAYERARTGLPLHAKHVLMSMEEGTVDAASVPQAWRIAWLSDAARKLRRAEPVLLRFGGLQLSGLRTEYARLDASVMEMRRRVVAGNLMLRRPPEGNHSPRPKEMTELVLLRW